jgi:glycine/D-amino acid oxidase-like deaminating enzyme
VTHTSEVLIIGAGILGTATAYELTRRGVAVTLLDRAGISEGTTGLGEGNALCADKDTGPPLQLAVAGRPVLEEHAALAGDAARVRRKGALIVHTDPRAWRSESGRAERLSAAGVDARLVDPDQLAALEPRLTGAVCGAVFVPGDLQCDPRAIARALADAAAGHGAQIRTHSEVATIEPDGVRLVDGQHVKAGSVVLAAGPWSAPLAATAGLHLPLEPRKGQLTRLRLPTPDPGFLQRKVIDGSYLASIASADPDRQISTVVETTWDGHVIIGSTRERSGFDPTVNHQLAQAVHERAARLVPSLAGL